MRAVSSYFFITLREPDFTWDPLTCSLSKFVLKWCFLETGLNKSLPVCNLRNKVATVLRIFVFESRTTNSHNPEKDACLSRIHSMFYETPLRINISLREIFPKSDSLWEMKKYCQCSHADLTRVWVPLTFDYPGVL